MPNNNLSSQDQTVPVPRDGYNPAPGKSLRITRGIDGHGLKPEKIDIGNGKTQLSYANIHESNFGNGLDANDVDAELDDYPLDFPDA